MCPRPLGAAVPDEESDGVAVGESELLVALHQESGVSRVLVTLALSGSTSSVSWIPLWRKGVAQPVRSRFERHKDIYKF